MDSEPFHAALLQYQIWEADEDQEADQDTLQMLGLASALIIVGYEEDREQRVERRNQNRSYLTRSQLLPSPRWGTPWRRLLNGCDDRAYIVTMGLDVDTFKLVLSSGFEERWNLETITRPDVSPSGTPRLHRRFLDAAGGLGLVLHFLSSTMREVELQQIFALTPATVSRYLAFGLWVLLDTLKVMPSARISWPTQNEFKQFSELVMSRHPMLNGAFGTIDGLNLPCTTSSDIEIENATYNGWLHEHFISSVLVFSPAGTILACNLNCPGSWHDSRVAQPIYEKLRTCTPYGYYLVSDTAFPRGTTQIHGRIKAPIKAGQQLPFTGSLLQEKLQFDRQLLSYRQTAEWGMRAIQGSFGRLRVPLSITHKHLRCDLLESCVRLHQLRTRLVGINQIQSVYVPIWKNGDQEQVWNGFETMLFSDQQRKDRVSRFHVIPVYE